MIIKNKDYLRELYGWPSERAHKKQLSELEKHSKNFISKSPFLILSTCDSSGNMDASPRGGNPGFIKVINDNEIILPDAKGNNRVDSLMNIVDTGTIGILFLIPGVDETLRINGKAYLTTDSKYLDLFSSERIPPKTCVVIDVEEVYLHCAKALMRSKLWLKDYKIDRKEFPKMGQMLKDQIGSKGKIETQEEMITRYKKDI